MKHTHFTFGFQEREHRLCHFGAFDSAVNTAADGTKWFFDKLTYVTAEVAVGLGKVALAVPTGVLKGVKDSWKEHGGPTTQEELAGFLYGAAEFFKNFPLIGGTMERYINSVDSSKRYEIVKQLVNQRNWINLFVDDTLRTKLLEDPVLDPNALNALPAGTVSEGQRAIWDFLIKEAVSVSDRQKLFMNFVDSAIPTSVQEKAFGGKLAGVTTRPGVTLNERFDRLTKDEQKVFADAVSGVFGVTEPTGDANTIAVDSLKDLYRPGSQIRIDDYQNLLRYQSGYGKGPIDNTKDGLLRNAPPNRFAGALRLKVIQQPDLAELGQAVDAVTHERNLMKQNVAKRLEKLTGAGKLEAAQDSKSIFDTIADGGPVLWAAMAGLAFYLRKNEMFQGASATLIGGYIILKLKGDPNPEKTMAGWAKNITNFAGDKIHDYTGFGKGPMDGKTSDLVARAKAAVDFMPPGQREFVELRAEALALLAEMSMSDLAESFDMPGTTGARGWCLKFKDTALRTRLKARLEQLGWKTGVDAFFAQPFIAGGVGYAFYKVAIANPSNFADARLVEEGKKLLPQGQSVLDFPKNIHDADPARARVFQEADKAFVRLVAQGKTESMGNKRDTLASVMIAENAKPALEPVDKAREEMVKKFGDKRASFMRVIPPNKMPPVGPGVKVELDTGTLVKISFIGGVPPSPVAEVPLQRFLDADVNVLWTKFDAWSGDAAKIRASKNPLDT